MFTCIGALVGILAFVPLYLNNVIFNGNNGSTIEPDAEDIKGFNDYISAYKAALNVEKSACDSLSL